MKTELTLLQPQPVGLTPWPHGGLLLPDEPGVEAVARAVVTEGRSTAELDLPEALSFWAAAGRDDTEGALAALEGLDGPIAAYNRFVLAPSEAALDELRARSEGILRAWLEVAAYQLGLRDAPPQTGGLSGALLALAHASRASAALEAGAFERASEELHSGVRSARECSPALAAQLRLSLLEIERGMLDGRDARAADPLIASLRDLLAELPAPGFPSLRAEVQLELGGLLQETSGIDRRRLTEAIGLFQDCLRALDPERFPRAHGFAQMRLGLAYLSTPMRDAGDALRMGVATQALREAVAVLSPEREPELWCSAACNLANVYQVLPSGHLTENLEAAIELYGQVLECRTAQADPVGHARVLVNRGNAFASLERSREALADLETALPLLQPHVDPGELEAVRFQIEDLRQVCRDAALSVPGPAATALQQPLDGELP